MLGLVSIYGFEEEEESLGWIFGTRIRRGFY